jgi:hypothetical protein
LFDGFVKNVNNQDDAGRSILFKKLYASWKLRLVLYFFTLFFTVGGALRQKSYVEHPEVKS